MVDDDSSTILETKVPGKDPTPLALEPDGETRYTIGAEIARGGMGEVRNARDTRIERDVAVKLMRSELRDAATVSRFFREARVQGGLEHPAVVPVYDLGIDHTGNPYFVMKKLAGTTLQDVLVGKTGTWTRQQLLARFVDVCFAVGFAHSRGVVHRDIKPANIMLGDFGEAYVLDWGLARIGRDDEDSIRSLRRARSESGTQEGDLLGTPGYMSPEQARGAPVNERADVFSLGCVLYEILAGTAALPHGIAALAETLEASNLRPSTRDPDVPPELDDLCASTTSQDPEARPPARELAEKLQAYLDGDRDLSRRKQLAGEHVERARVALDAGDDDESRAASMREVGRALVFDPSNVEAQELLARLLIAPDRIPAAALAEADAERASRRQIVMRESAGGFFGGAAMACVLFTLPLHAIWPVVTLIVLAIATGSMIAWMARRELPLRTPWELVVLVLNCLLLMALSLVFGPLHLTPIFAVGSLAAFLSQPTTRPKWLIVCGHIATLAIPLALELAGILPSTFETSSGQFVLKPWVVDLTPWATTILIAFALVAQGAITFTVMSTNRRAHETALNRVHSQHWHLHQMLPKHVR